jgi:hypothetical protein
MMIKAKKSQISTEFMIFSGMAIVLAIILISISSAQIKSLHQTKEHLELERIGSKVQKEISTTSYVVDGYVREFELPDKANNKIYNMTIINNTLSLHTNSTSVVVEILNITGYVQTGKNVIRKTDGVAYFNE